VRTETGKLICDFMNPINVVRLLYTWRLEMSRGTLRKHYIIILSMGLWERVDYLFAPLCIRKAPVVARLFKCVTSRCPFRIPSTRWFEVTGTLCMLNLDCWLVKSMTLDLGTNVWVDRVESLSLSVVYRNRQSRNLVFVWLSRQEEVGGK